MADRVAPKPESAWPAAGLPVDHGDRVQYWVGGRRPRAVPGLRRVGGRSVHLEIPVRPCEVVRLTLSLAGVVLERHLVAGALGDDRAVVGGPDVANSRRADLLGRLPLGRADLGEVADPSGG